MSKYCCLKCQKDVHRFNNNMLYCIGCGNTDINIIYNVTCNGCLATYIVMLPATKPLGCTTDYKCPSCTHIIRNMGPKNKGSKGQA